MKRIKFLRKVLFVGLLLGLAAGITLPSPAMSAWPTKDITLIVPFSPGGGYDTQSRIFAPVWEKKLPQKANVIVMNKTGAGGKIGSMALIRSASDGYTIGTMSPSALSWMQTSGELENIDIRRLCWLGQLSWEDGAVVVNIASGIKTIQDLTKREVRFGIDADSIFPAAMLAKQLNMKVRMVMFDGTSGRNLAAMRGDVDIMVDSVSGTKRGVNNSKGTLAPLFTIGETRAPDWSEVPCSKELGMELGDLKYIAGSARSLVAPSGVPAALLKSMQDSVWQALNDPAFKANMEKAGFIARPGSAAEAAKTVTTIIRVLEENREILESLKKK